MEPSRRGTPRPLPVVRIRPTRGLGGLGLGELWERRELLYFLAWRDVKVRYKQTALGFAWALLQPLLAMAVLTLVFGRIAGVPSDGAPYPLFVLAALVPWQLVAHVLAQAGGSVVASERLVTKVYFPRLAIPLATVLAALPDFLVSLAALLGLMLYHGVAPGLRVVALVPLTLLALAVATGLGTGLAALNVRYRDVRYVIPFLAQIWLFLTPVAYPTRLVPEGWRALYALNPLVGVVDGFRSALLGIPLADRGALTVGPLAGAAAVLVAGLAYFRRSERRFADVL